MGNDLILGNLRRKRAYLGGEIEAGKQALRRKKGQLYVIDRMLRLLDAGADPNTIKGIRPHNYLEGLRQGDQTRLCFEALRDAAEPLTMPELALAVSQRKGIANSPELRSRLRGTLGRLTREGRLRKVGKPRTIKWALVE